MKVERRTTPGMRARRVSIRPRVTRLEWPRRIRLSIASLMCWSGTSTYLATRGSSAIASISSSSNALGKV